MNVVIRIVASADGSDTPYAGCYVKDYKPASMNADGDYREDGWLRVTPNVERALHFTDAATAFAYWRQQNGLRPDGEPNRPLTSYTVEIGSR